MTQEPHSIAEVTAALLLWAKRSGPGLALVEFASEYARQMVFQQLQDGLGQPFAELVFHSTGDLERDVRHLVDQLGAEKCPLVSVRGIADAFLSQEERRRVLGLLNFLRESISRFTGKQIWWVTPEVGRLLQLEATDWHSWFSPRLELREETVVSHAVSPVARPAVLSMDRAKAIVQDARERLVASEGNASTAERWRQLADPAIVALQQAADLDGARVLREELLDLIYGEAHDARRQQHIRQDIDVLMAHRYFAAAATLAGDGAELALAGATDDRRREALFQVGLAKGRSGNYSRSERVFRQLTAELEKHVREGRGELANDLAATLVNWGVSLDSLGDLTKSVEVYDRAIAIREQLVSEGRRESENDLASALMNRGVSLDSLGRLSEAVEAYSRAISILERLVGEGRHELENNLAGALMNRGVTLCALGRLIESLKAHDRAIAIRERLVGDGHRNLENDLAGALMNRGVSLGELGRLSEAVEAYDRAISIRERLVGEGRRELEEDLAAALMNRGISLGVQGQLAEAVEAYDRAIEILKRLVGEPRRELLPSLAKALANRGVTVARNDRVRGCVDLRAARRAYVAAAASGHQGLGEEINWVAELLRDYGCASGSPDANSSLGSSDSDPTAPTGSKPSP